MRRPRYPKPENVCQELADASFWVAMAGAVATVIAPGAGIHGAGIHFGELALGFWLSSGWLWLRGATY